MGYSRAGFEVVGVDIKPQPRYPFEFHQADALEFLCQYAPGGSTGPVQPAPFGKAPFAAVHASPPCQAFSQMRWPTVMNGRNRVPKIEHPDLLTPTRALLAQCGLPYAIENVVGAPGPWSVLLCGTMFGLEIRRHRYFQTSFPSTLTLACSCRNGTVDGRLVAVRHGSVLPGCTKPPRSSQSAGRAAMGVEWMTIKEAGQAIPPAYTEWIGRQLLAHLEATHA